jgi:hypothetical protein
MKLHGVCWQRVTSNEQRYYEGRMMQLDNIIVIFLAILFFGGIAFLSYKERKKEKIPEAQPAAPAPKGNGGNGQRKKRKKRSR